MKNQYTIPNVLAVTSAIVFILCRLLVGLFPDASFAIAQSWFHGIEISKAGTWNLTMSPFLLGLISITVTAWIIGFIFTSVYKFLAK